MVSGFIVLNLSLTTACLQNIMGHWRVMKIDDSRSESDSIERSSSLRTKRLHDQSSIFHSRSPRLEIPRYDRA